MPQRLITTVTKQRHHEVWCKDIGDPFADDLAVVGGISQRLGPLKVALADRKSLLNWVEVGAIWRQVHVDNVVLFAYLSYAATMMDSAVVHNNYAPGAREGIHEWDLSHEYQILSTEGSRHYGIMWCV
jgi:hypothetical protein